MSRPDVPFNGKTVMFGGDFGQVLPVVRKGPMSEIVDSTLRKSYLWECMRDLRLVHNMRAQSDPWYVEYLLRIGNDTEEADGDGNIRIPDDICVPYIGKDADLNKLIDNVFSMLNANLTNPKYITSRSIVSTQNECVDTINMKMIGRFQGDEMEYHSFDRVEDDPHNYYPPESLNSLTPNGLPPHVLKLKVSS
ncbi:uncharacterized protein LOC133890197 [Phragmites australis]|uniref:uncharacterized protein LOC133890197 n=1 Tax=Phragmites australis TaxID=29695 RepID=UPI002D7A3584|nr:uncharacterized protein LOC133890197 [Phragmites australis]